ncbi:MAG: hypothetical protein AAFY42_14820, partial [Pseudomonadota bacterium]
SAQSSLFGGSSGTDIAKPRVGRIEPYGDIEKLNIEKLAGTVSQVADFVELSPDLRDACDFASKTLSPDVFCDLRILASDVRQFDLTVTDCLSRLKMY